MKSLLTSDILLGVGDPRSCTGYPKKTPEIIIQDMCWPRSATQVTADRVTRQPYRNRAMPRWIWGCVEA